MQCMDRTSLEQLLGQGLSLAEIGRRFDLHESTVGYWVEKHGLRAANRQKHAARGGLTRERLEPLVEQGRTIAEIADLVDRSKATVRHWLTRYGLRTTGYAGRRSGDRVQAAKQGGLRSATLDCRRHGATDFVIDGGGVYRCRRCRSEAVSRRRRKVKATLVEEAGGCCRVCGYDRNMRALHFHHLDPSHKRLAINAKGVALALDTLRAEARKCVLLCSNCHAEVEDGVTSIPLDQTDVYPPG